MEQERIDALGKYIAENAVPMTAADKESWDDMITRCAWEIVHGLTHGRDARSVAVSIVNIVLGWQKENQK
jgi:hypothetical protein